MSMICSEPRLDHLNVRLRHRLLKYVVNVGFFRIIYDMSLAVSSDAGNMRLAYVLFVIYLTQLDGCLDPRHARHAKVCQNHIEKGLTTQDQAIE